MRIKRQPRFYLCEKFFYQEDGHSSDLDQSRSGILLMIANQPEGEWDRVADLMMIKFGESGHPVFRATSPLSQGTLKSRGGGNYRYTSVPMGIRLKLFFAQFLFISSVSTKQSQICMKNTKPAM